MTSFIFNVFYLKNKPPGIPRNLLINFSVEFNIQKKNKR